MENQNNPQGKLGSAAWLIRWVDSWKKLAILIVLTLFSIASYLAYDYRREITYWALAHYGTPRIDQTKIDAEVRSMMSDTGGVTVSVWSLNLQRNQRIALYVRIREQRLSNLEGVGDLIFRPHSKLSMAVIDLLDKKTVCYDLVQSTAVGRAASAAGAGSNAQDGGSGGLTSFGGSLVYLLPASGGEGFLWRGCRCYGSRRSVWFGIPKWGGLGCRRQSPAHHI